MYLLLLPTKLFFKYVNVLLVSVSREVSPPMYFSVLFRGCCDKFVIFWSDLLYYVKAVALYCEMCVYSK